MSDSLRALLEGAVDAECAGLVGCTCEPPPSTPDASTPPTIAWPPGAKLQVVATTSTTAQLQWPSADGAVANYRLTWPGATRDETGTTAVLSGLLEGKHLPVEVVALTADGLSTEPLRAEVAPAAPLEPTDGDISTDFCGANAFLQRGVPIPCDEFSALIGHVRTRDGVGVPGLRVSVLGHPEWGTATTQADGLYALGMAAGRLTVDLRASSFIPLQRFAVAKARDFTYLPDTVVLRRDVKATAITLAAGGFHQATTQQDEDGARTTSVFVPAGTDAWLRLADGGTQSATTLTLRATEATVGNSGPEAMPATLPGATAYTFAADFSADEAVAAGALGVGFATPVAVYADNFLHYPVGAAIPFGVYDDVTGRWESGPNAVVLQVVAGGVDYTGDGTADADFPLLPGEIASLAAHFTPGTQLVRSQMTHFSVSDSNACWKCVGSCVGAGQASAAAKEANCDCKQGSLIRVQNQTLSEFMEVSGTAMSLGWHSNRAKARKAAVDLSLGALADGGEPKGVAGTYFRLEVAGRRFVVENDDGGVGDTARLEWDNKDAFGRPVRGPVAATATTGYGFTAVSVSRPSGRGTLINYNYDEKDFGVWPPPGALVLSSTREAAFFLKHHSLSLGDWVPRENLGNLSLDILHGYSQDGTLHLGTGAETPATESGAMVRYFAGGGSSTAEDAGSEQVSLGSGPVVAEGPQGVYFIENQRRVRLLRPDAGVLTVAGDTSLGFAGDGLPGPQGRFSYPSALELDPAGSLYISDTGNYRIRKLDAVTGLLSTVVGNGTRGSSPDGTVATEASLDGVTDLLFGHDGHLYFIAEGPQGVLLRRVENGQLKTVAGGSTAVRPPWESDAPQDIAFRSYPHWLAQDVEGALYVAGYDYGDGITDFVVRKIELDGRVRRIAGGGMSLDPEEPEARNTCLSGISGLAVGLDGTVYVGEAGTNGCALRGPGVRAVSPDGAFSLFLGAVARPAMAVRPPDGVAALTQWSNAGEVVLRRTGELLVVHDYPSYTLHEVVLPAANASRLVLSRDGEEVYAFDARGRHLRTVSARTGQVLWQFAWDANGLASVTDFDGEVTRVERDAAGQAQALVAPDGQRTVLTLDDAGRALKVTDAAGASWRRPTRPTG